MRLNNINVNAVRATEHLYDNISAWMAAQENGSEQQLESGKDVFFHQPYSTFFSKRLCLLLWKNMMGRLA